MKTPSNFKYLIIFSLFLLAIGAHAQYGQVRVDLDFEVDNKFHKYFFVINQETELCDTVIFESEFNTYDYFEIDSLIPGNYYFEILNDTLDSISLYEQHFQIKENKITKLEININSFTSIQPLDKKSREELTDSHFELRFELGYNANGFIDKSKYLNQNFNVHFTELYWKPLSNHFGILFGGGLGTSQHIFGNDTTFIQHNASKKRNERYSYWQGTLNFDARISSGNQKLNITFPSKFTLDLGASYHIPIFFRHITNYENNIKVTNKYIHQFTDLRSHINFGYEPFLFSIEYRYLDFILGKYPEIPKYMFSLKFNFHG
jgi:hypothetical protein